MCRLTWPGPSTSLISWWVSRLSQPMKCPCTVKAPSRSASTLVKKKPLIPLRGRICLSLSSEPRAPSLAAEKMALQASLSRRPYSAPSTNLAIFTGRAGTGPKTLVGSAASLARRLCLRPPLLFGLLCPLVERCPRWPRSWCLLVWPAVLSVSARLNRRPSGVVPGGGGPSGSGGRLSPPPSLRGGDLLRFRLERLSSSSSDSSSSSSSLSCSSFLLWPSLG